MAASGSELLSPAEAARRVGVTEQWLEDARRRRVGPPVHRLGHRTIRYERAALEKWIASRLQVAA
jgi:hypothetical protein